MRSKLQERIAYASNFVRRGDISSGSFVDFGTGTAAPIAQTFLTLSRVRFGTTSSVTGLSYLWSRGGPRAYIQATGNGGNHTFGFAGSSTGVSGRPTIRCAAHPNPVGNSWFWCAGIWDGGVSVSSLTAYYGRENNVLQRATVMASLTGTGSGASNSASHLSVGCQFSGANAGIPFSGDIALFALWDGALSIGDLLRAQSFGPDAVPSGLLVNWFNNRDNGPNKYAATLGDVGRSEVIWTPPPRRISSFTSAAAGMSMVSNPLVFGGAM